MKRRFTFLFALITLGNICTAQTYVVVDTGQTNCYNASGTVISPPAANSVYYGQDAQFQNAPFSYHDNGDGTVSDLNTGLMWQQTTDTNRFTWADAVTYAATNQLAGYTDWRLPEIKELVSLTLFYNATPTIFISTNYFTLWTPADFGLSTEMGQTWANTICCYKAAVTGNQGHWMFNFSDGHLKGNTKGPNWVRIVRGPIHGINNFVNNGDGTVTDLATGLMWQQADAGIGMDWTNALVYAKNLRTGGYADWRLPNVKELDSILDYTRGPDAVDPTKRSAAIDTNFFSCTLRSDTLGYYWTSTTAVGSGPGGNAYYVAFGEALAVTGVDTHGPGAIRTDPKVGDTASWTNGLGPSPSDVVCITNFVRCVRNATIAGFTATPITGGAPLTVTFTDLSIGILTNRSWSFGDGAITNTTATNLIHTYRFPSTNTVRLIGSGPGGLSTNVQANLVIATSVDTVGDGIPNWWRAQYFPGSGGTNTNATSCATCDFTGTGQNNYFKYVADLNPTNPASRLAIISITTSNTNIQVTWTGGTNSWQYLECSPVLTTNQWLAIFTNVPPTSLTTNITHTGATAATNLFYRIKTRR